MSLARVLATGNGKLSFRLSVAGVPYEMVTDAAMQRTASDGRIRKVGLKRQGIQDEWECQLERGTAKTSGFTATIVDYDDVWLGQFAARATKTCYLKSTEVEASNDWSVTDSTDFTVDTWLHIGQEAVKLTAKPSATQMTVTRGQWDTTAVKYWSEPTTDGSRFSSPIRITDRPERYEGRNVTLYAYGEGDDPQGDGTAVFLGVVSTEPAMRGPSEWSFQVDGIARKLEQYLGADLGGSMRPRGIRRLSNLSGRVRYWAAAPNFSDTPDDYANFSLDGPDFWETQEDFCAALTTELQAAAATIGAWSSPVIYATPSAERGYDVVWTSPGGWVDVCFNTDLDGIDGKLGGNPLGPSVAVYSIAAGELLDPIVAQTATYAYRAPTLLELGFVQTEMAGSRFVPRGVCLPTAAGPGGTVADGYTRIYLGGDQDIAAIGEDLAIITIPGVDGAPARSIPIRITASDNDDRWIEVAATDVLAFTSANLPDIKQTRYYAQNVSVGTFVSSIVTDAPTYSTMGAYPALFTTDVDQATWAAAGRLGLYASPVLASRNYFASQPVRLDKMLAEELKAGGLALVPDATGKISVTRVRMQTSLSADLQAIEDEHINIRALYPEWEPARFGSIHTVTFKASYDPVAETHFKPTYLLTDETSKTANPLGQKLAVELFSEWQGMFTWVNGVRVQTLLTESELQLLFSGTLGLFGQPYQIIRIACDLRMAEVRPGQGVTVTSRHIPDWSTGQRGVQQLPCLVVGRKREWDRGVVTLTLMAQGPARVGYAPSYRVTAVSGSGADRTFTVSNAFTHPLTFDAIAINVTTPEAYIVAGDRVTHWVWNTGTPSPQTGTVTAVTSTTIAVTFDAAYTALTGSEQAMISFADADDATGISETQKLFAYDADTSRRINVDGSVIDARVYA